MARKLKTYQEILFVDFEYYKDSEKYTKEELSDNWERFDAACNAFDIYCFKQNIGEWSGRESTLSKTKHKVYVAYYLVLAKNIEQVKSKIQNLIKNFDLADFTKIAYSDIATSKGDVEKELKAKEELSLTYSR